MAQIIIISESEKSHTVADIDWGKKWRFILDDEVFYLGLLQKLNYGN